MRCWPALFPLTATPATHHPPRLVQPTLSPQPERAPHPTPYTMSPDEATGVPTQGTFIKKQPAGQASDSRDIQDLPAYV